MTKGVWITAFGERAQDKAKSLLEAFNHPEITPRSDADHSDCALAVVVFDSGDNGVVGFAQREILGRGMRAVGVAAEPDAATPNKIWALLEAGFRDTLRWCDPAEVVCKIVAARLLRWEEVESILDSELIRDNLIGRSAAWLATLRALVEVACYSNAPVLLTGESGTGKELCARLIHALDARACKRELVTVDCTTLMPELSGSELFGHERGAFTGAAGAREGAFALANDGTLFLDEVGELSLRLQAQLLRSIQERRYKRVGGNQWRNSSFRLVSATNRDLSVEVTEGRFRSDLYFRIAGCSISLPPLRDRPEDILPLSQHFLCEMLGCDEPPEIDPAVEALLLDRRFPGNVRELRQLIARVAVAHVGGGPVTPGEIPRCERPRPEGNPGPASSASFEPAVRRALCLQMGLQDIGRSVTETAIRLAISDEKGNIARAARRLSITPRALQLRVADARSRGPSPARR